MHDPMTVAFDIPNPFLPRYNWNKTTWRNRPPLITIWHVDPERGGSDDSCGWSYPRLTAKQRERMNSLAFHEAHDPWFLACDQKGGPDAVTCELLIRGAVLLVARVLGIRVTLLLAERLAAELTHNPGNHILDSLCHIPGYTTNIKMDLVSERERAAAGFYCMIAKHILREKRWWFQYPRWHVWHWKIQIHPLQNLKRWLFSRCDRCGGRFRYGESPVSGSWHGTGPLWFRSEKNIRHSGCCGHHEDAV